MRNFDLQIIWSAKTPYSIPGFLALHVHIESQRTAIPVNNVICKWFHHLEPEQKAELSFIHLN
ncbi:MAG TPA: hypothetical protein VEV87_07785 [Chitinophagaceae bacterium]|nr:hypothetical protein [Chitinophagaceae bacterium]